jgi:chorismate mutase
VSDETLDRLRAEIDGADAQIVDALAARWRAVLAVAAHKRARGIAAHDPARESSLRARWITRARSAAAPEALAGAVVDAVIERCREAVRA